MYNATILSLNETFRSRRRIGTGGCSSARETHDRTADERVTAGAGAD